jgi:hypothetical protein
MAEVMRWAVTFDFKLRDEEKEYLTPLVEAQDYGLLVQACDDVCAGRGREPSAGLVLDMWQIDDDGEFA